MSDNTLSLRITADIVDLQTKFAVAKAEVNGLTSEMNKLARQSAAGTIDAAGSAQLKQFAGDLLAARQSAAGYAGELAKAGVAVGGFGRSMESGHGSIATATREFRALFDELSSGRTRQTPGTLAIIAQRVLGLGPAALGAVAGVGALAGGLAYLAYRALEASKSLDSIEIGAKFAGNLALSRETLQELSTELAKVKGISDNEARGIVGSFASMNDMSATQVHALAAVVGDFAASTGQDADKAAEALKKIFADKESAAEYARSLNGVSQNEINMAEAADRSGNAQAVFAAKFDLLNTALNRSRSSIDQYNSRITASFDNLNAYIGLTKSGYSADAAEKALLDEQNTARAKQVELLKQLRAEMANQPASPDQTIQAGVKVAEAENPVSQQVDESKSKIAEMNSALTTAQELGDQLSVDKLNAGLSKANEELSALQFGPVLERMREQMSQVAATWDGTQSGMLAKQLQVAQQTLASVTSNSKQRLEVETEISHLEVQERQAAGAEIIANARNQTEQIAADESRSALQRLEAERDVWAQLIGNERLTASQRIEVQRSYSQELIAITRETKSESDAIARSDASTDVAIARLQIDAKRSELEEEVEAQRISAAQKLEILRELSAQEFALNLDVLQSELKGLQNEPAEYERVYNEIRELKAKLVADLEGMDKSYEAEAAKEKKQESEAWKEMVSEIESAETTFIGDVLGRRKSMSQSLIGIGQQLVTKEIENDAKALTAQIANQGTQKTLEQSGLLYHLLVQAKGTDASVQAQAAQTDANVAGNAARLSSQASTAAAGAAIQKTVGGSTVMADAAKAFSGTYASVAQIPYVGWVLAPIAAGAAFAAVAGYESLASLDVGAWNIPHDMVAQVHEGETIMPKNFAEGWRANVGSGSGTGGGSNSTTTHNYGNISVSDTSMRRLMSSKANQRAVMSAMAGAYRRGAR